jgi:hypothetical protein
VLHRRLTLLVGHSVLWRRSASGLTSLSGAVLIGVAHLAAGVLGHIGYNLHATRNNALGTTVTDSIRRSSWAAEALSQLLNQSATDIVGGNVDSISDTKNHE